MAKDNIPKNDYSQTDGEIPLLRWSNRRRMAWWCIYTFVIYTAIFWFGLPLWFHFWGLPLGWLTVISESYSWFASICGGVVIAYMGFNQVTGFINRKMGRPSAPSFNEDRYEENQEEPEQVPEEEYYDPSHGSKN